MDEAVWQRLLQLNRDFYDVVAEPFDETRQGWTPGKRRLLTYLPTADGLSSPRVADIGCGNGRFALMLDSLKADCHYSGVDGNTALLTFAAERTAHLAHVNADLFLADLADDGWTTQSGVDAGFDLVVCLATLQHMPGYGLRRRLMADLASLLGPNGLLAVSAWQFLESDRFRRRLIDWREVGLDATDVEPGDALLPWKQDVYAVRYVHQIDEEEMACLAADAGLSIVETYRADGREGNLNLYALFNQRT